MPSKSKSNKVEKGCVGIVYGGVLKASKLHIFKHENTELEDFAKNLSQYYGTEFDIKYVPVEDFDDVYEKFLETLDQEQRVSQTPVFNVSISDASKILKEVAEAKACKSFTLKKKEKEAEAEEEEDDKSKKKSSSKKSKNDSEAEEEEEEDKTKKKSSSKKSKDESEAEEDEEEEKPKKKSSSKKSKDSKDDSEAEEDEEDDNDKKLKKKGKTDEKKSKSKSK